MFFSFRAPGSPFIRVSQKHTHKATDSLYRKAPLLQVLSQLIKRLKFMGPKQLSFVD